MADGEAENKRPFQQLGTLEKFKAVCFSLLLLLSLAALFFAVNPTFAINLAFDPCSILVHRSLLHVIPDEAP
jgi:hypothetical protein